MIIDAHLDLSTNALSLNRDLRKSVQEIRQLEINDKLTDTHDRGKGTVAFPEMRKGGVGLVIATLISRSNGVKIPTLNLPGWNSPEQAYAFAQGQIAWYKLMEQQGYLKLIANKKDLESHLKLWNENSNNTDKLPIGYILSLEGADSIIDLDYLDIYYQQGLRAIGPAHFGPGRYAAGTHSDGTGLTELGVKLLQKMQTLGMALDCTHLTDKGFFEAMEIFSGTIWASHQNCRSLVPGERQFSDQQLRIIIEKGGVIGASFDAWMLTPDFPLDGQQSTKALEVNLEKVVNHWDHICQLAGNSNHVAIGSDLDGLFGLEQSPYDLDSISDLSKLRSILEKRGYTNNNIENILYKNWLRMFNAIL
jgi:membrane dipeptidase